MGIVPAEQIVGENWVGHWAGILQNNCVRKRASGLQKLCVQESGLVCIDSKRIVLVCLEQVRLEQVRLEQVRLEQVHCFD